MVRCEMFDNVTKVLFKVALHQWVKGVPVVKSGCHCLLSNENGLLDQFDLETVESEKPTPEDVAPHQYSQRRYLRHRYSA